MKLRVEFFLDLEKLCAYLTERNVPLQVQVLNVEFGAPSRAQQPLLRNKKRILNRFFVFNQVNQVIDQVFRCVKFGESIACFFVLVYFGSGGIRGQRRVV